MLEIVHADGLEWMKAHEGEFFDLLYFDPPFNTRKTRQRGELSYEDDREDYQEWLLPFLQEGHRLLRPHGSLFLHMDEREGHYAKVALDGVFGRNCFQNQIIWAYDFGGRATKRWSRKHDMIFWYSKHPKKYTFNFDQMDRIPYMAPGLVSAEKVARGKTPTDCWWHTIVPTNGKEKTGYPTQKPLGVLERIVKVHSYTGDRLLDCFAGSGTFGAAALKHSRRCVLVDTNPQAIAVMEARFGRKISTTAKT